MEKVNKLRRTMLFCPANEPKLYQSAPAYNPDCIIFDLEDAISYTEKDAARDLLCEALKVIDFGNVEVFARINPLYTEFGKIDVTQTVAAGLRNIRLPMCESKKNVEELDVLLTEVEKVNGIEEGSVKIQCAIETPKGVFNAAEIASASKRVISISFGAEDYTNSLGTERVKGHEQLAYARGYVALVASLYGVDAIDTVWTDLDDHEGFEKETRMAKSLGFKGKSCIHPAQIKVVKEIYTPSEEEAEKARGIIEAAAEAEKNHKGVILFNGKMIDAPVINKARRILELWEMENRE